MKLIQFIIFIIITNFGTYSAGSETLPKKHKVVVVIDTGIRLKYIGQSNLCKSGHKSFVKNITIYDTNGHGTNIIGLIKKHAKNVKYCVIVVKFFGGEDSIGSMIKSLKYAYELKPDIINISAGGVGRIYAESRIIKKILDANIIMNVAAGNEGSNLDKKCNYYPACYDKRINVISAKDVPLANRGKIVDKYISGKNQTAFGIMMSGTSQATAIFTGMTISGENK